jgi:hypothetical protein
MHLENRLLTTHPDGPYPAFSPLSGVTSPKRVVSLGHRLQLVVISKPLLTK